MNVTELAAFGEPTGQGWTQLGELTAALVLSSMIGLEREIRQKSAGLRTHTLVGLGSALFLLISKYGFTDVLGEHVTLDPSRVAAQIVSGLGFIGGGLIFVRRDVVRGLTTAAVVWVTAAVGCACAAGLPILAVFVTAAHFLVVYGYPPLIRLLTRSQSRSTVLRLSYLDGRGVLRHVLAGATSAGFVVAEASTQRRHPDVGDEHVIDLALRVIGSGPTTGLAATLSELDGVESVTVGDVDDATD
jgi:putative Mg2+ transporter-C (MgtC) family protein